MHKFLKYIAIGAIAAAMPACADRMESPDLDSGSGTASFSGPYTMEVAFDFDNEYARSRADFEAPEIRDLWVGMFDTQTKTLIASEVFEGPNSTVNSDDKAIGNTVTLSNVFMNDEHPYAIIVGAANVGGVKVLRYTCDGVEKGEGTLRDVLTGWFNDNESAAGIKTIGDFAKLAVDVVSAEANARQGFALMSGVMATGHAAFTMNGSGSVSSDKGSAVDYQWKLFNDASSNRFREIYFDSANKPGSTGLIHLRRLVSKVNVEITTANGVTIEGEPEFQVCNVPTAVFLQERSTVTNPSGYTSSQSQWRGATMAASDFVGGYVNSEVYKVGESGTEDCFEVHEGESLVNSNSRLTFSYWHYENKHWGLESCDTYHKRDARFGMSDVFSSLCESEDKTYNNNATYILLRARIKDPANGYEGDVEYLIHEGYCSAANGTAATSDGAAARDFATFRNTNYNYTLQIAGLDNIRLSAVKDGNPSPGAYGDIVGTDISKPFMLATEGEAIDIIMPAGPVVWAFNVEGNNHGVLLSSIDTASPFYGAWQKVNPVDESVADFQSLYDSFFVMVDGVPTKLGDAVFSEETKTQLIVPAAQGLAYTLYLCCKFDSDDERSSYTGVMAFVQGLQKPAATMPGVNKNRHIGSETVMVGVTDHTLVWAPVSPMDPSHEIRYQTYISDKNNLSTLVEKALITEANKNEYFVNGKFYYKAKYSTMNGFADNSVVTFGIVTIEWDPVTNTEVNRSEMWTTTKTVKKAVWNFMANEWNAIKTAIKANNTTYEGGINEMMVSAGGASITTGEGNGIKMDGGGDVSIKKRVFYFNICARGTLTGIMLAEEAKRCMVFNVFDAGGTSRSNTQNTDGRTHTRNEAENLRPQATSSWEPALGQEGGTAYVYSSNSGITFYQFTFVPSDPPTN